MLPLSEFHRRRHYVRDGHRAACKACTAAKTHAARQQRPALSDPMKTKVRWRTAEAVRKGELVQRPCERCGAEKAQAHHPRYDSDDAHLQVIWLCALCHGAEHSVRGWTKQIELFGRAP